MASNTRKFDPGHRIRSVRYFSYFLREDRTYLGYSWSCNYSIFARCEFHGRTWTSWWSGTPDNWTWYKERFPSYISTWFDHAIVMHKDLEGTILDKGLVFVTGLTVGQSVENRDTFEVRFTSLDGKYEYHHKSRARSLNVEVHPALPTVNYFRREIEDRRDIQCGRLT